MLRNHKILNLFIGLLLASVSAHATLITMTNSDSTATTTYLQVSFTSKGFWNSSIAPSSANDYSTTATNSMRTPSDGTNYIFQGNSLTINGPGTTTAGGGRLITKNQPATALPITYTIANLVITNLGMIQNGANTSGSTAVIAGGITTSNGGWDLLPQNGSMVIAASVSGNGPLWLGSPSAASANSAIFMGAISNWTGSIFSVNNTTLLVLSNALTQTYSGNIMCTNNAVTVQGSGILTLSGTNTYAGKTTLSGGTLVLAGNEASVTNSTTVSSGATLQLQANSTNIVSGTSYSLGTAVTAANTFSVGSTIQFRSDSGVIFNGGANLGGLGNGINSWDVNQLTGAGANNTLTFAPAGFSVFNSTFNITGGNGYTLAVGPMNLIGTGGTLTLNASNANLTVNGITSVGASGVTTVLGSSNTTISAAITATTSLTKQGIGKLTLNGANTYVGSTLIQTGTVALASGATLASTNLNISVGATLDVGAFSGALAMNSGQYLIGKGAVNGSVDTASGGLIYPGGNLAAGTLTVTTNLTLSGGGTLKFDIAHNTAIGGGTNDLIVVGGNLNVAGSTTLGLNFLNGSPVTGTYTLIQYGTISGDTTLASITLPSNPRYSLTLSNDTVNKAVELVVVGVPGNLVWLGDGVNNGWDNAGTYQSWTNSASLSLDYFYDGDVVTFNDSGSDSPVINLTTVNLPGALTVNATQGYDFTGSGSIAGVASLTKSGSGTLILETANAYTGPTVINGGTLQIGNANTSGTLGSGSVTNNSTLVFNRTDGIGVANDIHGSGTLRLDGTGSITPTSTNNDYTGSTVINSGVFFLVTSTALGATAAGTTVALGAQLYITANVNVGAEPLTFAGVGLHKGGGGVTTYGGALTLSSNSTINVDGGATLILTNAAGIVGGSNALATAGSGTLTLGGPVTLGTNGLVINSGTVNLNSSNSYSGGTTLTAGVVNVNTNGALGSGLVTATTSGHFVIGTGLTITNAFTATIVNPGAATGFLMTPDNTNGTVTTLSGPLVFSTTPASGGTFAGPTSSGYLNLSGFVSNAPATAVTVRFGNVRFTGGGNYPELQIRANTTSIGVDNGIATNAVVDTAGNGAAFLNLNGFNQTLAGLKNTVTPANAALGYVTNSSATATTLNLNVGTGNTYTFGGHVVGNLALVVSSGTQTLTGSNGYTGGTTVNGGTLELATATIATNSTVTITNGATLQLDFSTTNQIAALVLNGVSQPAGVYNNASSPSFIAGSGNLLIASSVNTTPTNIVVTVSSGTLTLTWPTDHTGWQLQSQTNTLSTGLGTNWVDVANTSSTNSYSTTIDPTAPSVFYRLKY